MGVATTLAPKGLGPQDPTTKLVHWVELLGQPLSRKRFNNLVPPPPKFFLPSVICIIYVTKHNSVQCSVTILEYRHIDRKLKETWRSSKRPEDLYLSLGFFKLIDKTMLQFTIECDSIIFREHLPISVQLLNPELEIIEILCMVRIYKLRLL